MSSSPMFEYSLLQRGKRTKMAHLRITIRHIFILTRLIPSPYQTHLCHSQRHPPLHKFLCQELAKIIIPRTLSALELSTFAEMIL